MRSLLVFGLALVASASPWEIGAGYHEEVGIPLAEKIRVAEENISTGEVQNRIVGGFIAPENSHPYFGGLLIDLLGTSSRSVCGSSLVSHNRLVTAAHCWFDGEKQAWQFHVILGSNFLYRGGERIATREVFMHPYYFRKFFMNDIAMIYLPWSANIDNVNVRPIRLPNNSELWNTFEGYSAVAVGFGKTSDQQIGSSAVLSHVSLQVISHAQCKPDFDFVTLSTLCTSGAGGVGICTADSGGPLVTSGTDGQPFLIGVSSFVALDGCQKGLPSAFVRVTSFHSWISQHVF